MAVQSKKSIYLDSKGNEWEVEQKGFRNRNKFWIADCNELNKTFVGNLKKEVIEKIKLFIKK